jgi:uncharacterized protein (TIGR03067 family)
MKRFFGVLLVASASFVSGADDKKADAVAEELKKLEGTWLRLSFEFDGQKEDVDVKGARAVIKGNVVTFFIGEKVFGEATFSIDPTKKPKTMDSTSTKPEKGQKTLAIYELIGDNLKICVTQGSKRPTEFITKEGSGCALSVYKRAKK